MAHQASLSKRFLQEKMEKRTVSEYACMIMVVILLINILSFFKSGYKNDNLIVENVFSDKKLIDTPAIIIYNRVGKCGSRTVLSVIRRDFMSRGLPAKLVNKTSLITKFNDKATNGFMRFISDPKSSSGRCGITRTKTSIVIVGL